MVAVIGIDASVCYAVPSGNEWSAEEKVCRVYSFSGTKVPGRTVPGLKVPGNEQFRERMFQGTNGLENECSSIPIDQPYSCLRSEHNCCITRSLYAFMDRSMLTVCVIFLTLISLFIGRMMLYPTQTLS